jgi:2,4-dienoyl-CoA reductase-like NADH-dependent reductase (Old Yellow Enzyme family)
MAHLACENRRDDALLEETHMLFDPITVGTLTLPNRFMRSATAERLADPDNGTPLPKLKDIYLALAQGGVGLIVTGHAYVDRGGKAHPEMASIADDEMIPAWRETVRPAQEAGARVIMQINHCGSGCDPAITPQPLSPSGVQTADGASPRAMTEQEIAHVLCAFGQAARRARAAGLDGVQIHGAHGYLVTQFLSPMTNRRDDAWGGDRVRRRAFLDAVIDEIREQVGSDYPLWIKLGVAGKAESGLPLAEGARVAAACATRGVDCVEVSHASGIPEGIDTKQEAAFRPLAERVREAVGQAYPLALVYGFSTRAGMEAVLAGGLAQMVSLSRPLIAEPDLPQKLREAAGYQAACVRCGKCGPEALGEGTACYNAAVQRKLNGVAP